MNIEVKNLGSSPDGSSNESCGLHECFEPRISLAGTVCALKQPWRVGGMVGNSFFSAMKASARLTACSALSLCIRVGGQGSAWEHTVSLSCDPCKAFCLPWVFFFSKFLFPLPQRVCGRKSRGSSGFLFLRGLLGGAWLESPCASFHLLAGEGGARLEGAVRMALAGVGRGHGSHVAGRVGP